MAFPIEEVTKQRGISNPLRSYLWRVELPDFNSILTSPVIGDGVNKAMSLYNRELTSNFEISHRIYGITTPFGTVESDKALDQNSFWYFAKQNDIGNIVVDIYEYEDGKTLDYFRAWQSLMINSNGTYNPPVIYKKNVVFYRLNTTKQDIQKYTYSGYFVTGISDISNEYEASDIIKYSITLTGDSVDFEKITLENKSSEELTMIEEEFKSKKTFDPVAKILEDVIGF